MKHMLFMRFWGRLKLPSDEVRGDEAVFAGELFLKDSPF